MPKELAIGAKFHKFHKSNSVGPSINIDKNGQGQIYDRALGIHQSLNEATMINISDIEIEQAKKRTNYVTGKPFHQHPDCIRIAYQWLDAQQKTQKPNTRTRYAIKHLIESWARRYVSASDVEVAAFLHPEITGVYPCFNISSRLTRPNAERLEGISEAGEHGNYRSIFEPGAYSKKEE